MFLNYLKISVRNIRRHPLHSIINILGLAIGMTCTIMIMLWVQDELSYDKFHENADNLYRVVEDQKYSSQRMQVAVTPHPLAASLKKDYPEIINATRYFWSGLRNVVYEDKKIDAFIGKTVDPSFLTMFTSPFVKGDPDTALADPFSIILTKSMAERYFKTEEILGKILRVDDRHDLKITGLIEDIPDNSHLQFDYIISFETLSQMTGQPFPEWGTNEVFTYIQLQKNSDYRVLDKKITGYIKSKLQGSVVDLYLQPITEIHLTTGFVADIGGHGSIYNVYLFLIIAIFILVISCINYISLTTARYSIRAKEVGIRKVSGANRSQLIVQFLCESLILSFISLGISICMIELLLPSFNTLANKELSMEFFSNYSILALLLAMGVFTGVFSGIYPAFLLSFFKPVSVLKGNLNKGSKGSVFRKSMVLIQWTMAIILIIGTWVVYDQFRYLKNKDLGFNRDQLIYVGMDEYLKPKYDSVKNEFLKNPDVLYVTSCMNLPINIVTSSSGMTWEGKKDDETFIFHYNSIHFDFIEAFEMEMAEGRPFSSEFSTDALNGSNASFIFNETAIKKMELKDPIGKQVNFHGTEGPIVGILKDFNFKPLTTEIEPIVLGIVPDYNNILIAKISPENMQGTIESLKNKLREIIPDQKYEFSFLNENFNNLYPAEEMISKIFQYFTVLAIFIASLGLFALVGFMAEERTKEIGIRKSLGASAPGIVLLMTKNYLKLVIVANIIAWPVAYYFLSGWLNNYAYRININWIPFILTGVLVLVISQLTVSFHTIKAAMENPVKALRYE